MSIGVRNLTVLGEFKPFGLLAEALDGKSVDNIADNYNYFLFDSNIINYGTDDYEVYSDDSDHELFVRGNRIIWTTGLRVYKRFTLPSAVIKACWCRFGVLPEVHLCVLQVKRLTVFNISGEVVSISLPHGITSIWPLPFGLLLRQGIEGTLILKDPHEKPQLIYFEESGKHNVMMGFDERTIWTSDCFPLMATYNNGKMQHTLWSIEVLNSNIGVPNTNSNVFIPHGVLPKQFSFRRIWQENGAHIASSKVFLATDDDSIPIVCFLLQEQKKLQSVRLQSVERSSDIIFDIQPDISWSIAVITAEPVIVTRPRVKVGQLPFTDIIALVSDNTLLLYSGKHPLCKFSLPSCLYRSLDPHSLNSKTAFSCCNRKIIGLCDAIHGRISVILNSGQIFRCTLHGSTSSSLANDCITALAESLSSSLYMHFLVKLWADGDLTCPSRVDSNVNLEWESLCRVLLQTCGQLGYISEKTSSSVANSSWEFLCNSKFHKNYCQHNNGTIVSSVSSNDGTLGLEKLFYSELLRESLGPLHAVYETLKLDNLRKRDIKLLVLLLCKIADCLCEDSYLDHYIRDFPILSKTFRLHNTSFYQKPAPCIFRWLEVCLQSGSVSANINDLPPLILEDRKPVISWARKIVSFYSILFGAKRVGRKLSTGVYCNIAPGSFSSREELTVLTMVGEKFGLQQLDLLPAGVSLPLRHALDKCREFPPTDWPPVAYVLLGREDLALTCSKHSSKFKDFDTKSVVNLISVSAPYMLHLHPVTVPFTTSDTLGLDNTKYEDADSIDASLMDGMEHIFNSTTQLRYGRDMRLNEVRCLLCSAIPVAIQTRVCPAPDQDSQQAQLWQFAQRTTALPFGRGAFTVATISTLFTEAFTVPKLVLAGRLPAQQDATVKLDTDIRDVREFESWAEFHNAVASGLRLVPFQEKMSRTWIMYNKPEEPNAVHAGLLLALGLHGFLHVLSIADIFQYFSLEHESTTVGLMLGLAASYRGTMKASISKCFYFHVASRHPSSFPDLDVPTILQSTALVSLGILFEGSVHAQTMQILLEEIGRRSAGDNVAEKEGYAVSAGFSLGLVALGRGDVATGSMHSLVNRLLCYVGNKEFHSEVFLPFPLMDEYNHRPPQAIMDTSPINVDVTAPGATIALALLFLKTGSEAIVSRLSIPCTCFQLQYVRPEFIILRVIARNLIMWSRVQATNDWIQAQIPEIINDGLKGLSPNIDDVDEMDVEMFVQAYVNIVSGACISIGLKFAGTKDENAQELLYDYAVYFLNEVKHVPSRSVKRFPRGLSRHVDQETLEICLHFIVLSLSVVMAGSGNLQTFRLLRFLRNRYSEERHSSYGMQLVVSLAIGFLFLGGGMMTFSTNNSSIAALLITLYPRLPTGPNDNRCHLQAFRHLYILATEARWIQTVDVSTGLPVYAPLEVTIRETENYAETSFCEVSPCILPERAVLKSVRVCGPQYWQQVITLVPEEKSWWRYGDKKNPFDSGVLYIKRKVGACSYIDDPVGRQPLLSQAMHKVDSLTSVKTCNPNSNGVRRSEACSTTISQLVSAFSSDPSLTAFSQLFCHPSWKNGSDVDFQDFCLQVLFECVTKDRPALLQVYLSLNTMIRSMADQVTSGSITSDDSLFVSSLKLVLAYNDALLCEGLTSSSNGSIVQSAFVGSVRKRIQLILNHSQSLFSDLRNYVRSSMWPKDDSRSIHLSWYLKFFGVPSPAVIASAVDKFKPICSSSSASLLGLLLPGTHAAAIEEMNAALTTT